MNWVRRVFSSTWRWHGLSHFAISPSSARYLISQKSIFFATRQRLFAIGQSLQKCQKIRKSKRLKILPETKLFCSKHFNICLNNDSCVIEREKNAKSERAVHSERLRDQKVLKIRRESGERDHLKLSNLKFSQICLL